MNQRTLLAVLAAVGAYLVLTRGQAAAGPGVSALVPVTGGEAPFPALAMVRPSDGRYLFPVLPQGAAYTTDPATGQVYVTEIAVPSQPGYVSTSDILRR